MYVVYIGFCEGVVVAVIYIFVFLGLLGALVGQVLRMSCP